MDESTVTSPQKRRKSPIILRIILGFCLILFLALAGLVIVWAVGIRQRSDYLPKSSVLDIEINSLGKFYQQGLDSPGFGRLIGNLGIGSMYSMQMELRQLLAQQKGTMDWLLDMPVVASLDAQNHPLVIVDCTWRGIVLQLLPHIQSLINFEGLTISRTVIAQRVVLGIAPNNGSKNDQWYLVYDASLLLISNNLKVIEAALLAADNPQLRKPWALGQARQKLGDNFQVYSSFSASTLLNPLRKDNVLLSAFLDASSTLGEGIAAFKLDKEGFNCRSAIALKGESKTIDQVFSPSGEFKLLSELPQTTSMIMGLRANSLKELLDLIRQLNPSLMPDLEQINQLSSSLLGKTLDELIYSWVGQEYLVVNTGQNATPVLVISVKNQGALQAALDTLSNSLLLDIDQSTLVDGVRINRLVLPEFWKAILKAFGFEFELPYYILRSGQIIVSEDAEILALWQKDVENGATISKRQDFETFKNHGANQGDLILYYDASIRKPALLKNIPFLNGIIATWRHGMASLDFSVGQIQLNLQLEGNQEPHVTLLPGYPKNLERMPDLRGQALQPWLSIIDISGLGNPEIVYPINDSTLVITDLNGKVLHEFKTRSKARILVFRQDNMIMLLEEDGQLSKYIYTNNGFYPEGEAVNTDIRSSFIPFSLKNAFLLYNDTERSLEIFKSDGSRQTFIGDISQPVLQTPLLAKNYLVYYPRNLEGIFRAVPIDGDQSIALDYRIGSISTIPAIISSDGSTLMLVAEEGKAGFWPFPGEGGEPTKITKLPGPVRTEAIILGQNFALLDSNGNIITLDKHGTVVSQRFIPELAGEGAWIQSLQNGQSMLVGRGNLIWLLDAQLALGSGFPVAGGFSKLFNLDGQAGEEMISVGYDGKIYAYELP